MLKMLNFMFHWKISLHILTILFCTCVYGDVVNIFEPIPAREAYSWLPFREHATLKRNVTQGTGPNLPQYKYFVMDDTPYENFMGWKNSLIIYNLKEGFFLWNASLEAHQFHYFNWLIQRGKLSATIRESKVVRELSVGELVTRYPYLLQLDRMDPDYLREFHIGIIQDERARKNLLPEIIQMESLIFSDSETVRKLVLEVIEEMRALSDGEEPQTNHVPQILPAHQQRFLADRLEDLLFSALYHLLSYGAEGAPEMFEDFVRRGFFTGEGASYWHVLYHDREHLGDLLPEGWNSRV